jgi:23S rRNA (adenine1618-N6)-methyltransferase
MEFWRVQTADGKLIDPTHVHFGAHSQPIVQDIARIEKIANEYLPFPTEYRIILAPGTDPTIAKDSLNAQLTSLDLRWIWDPDTSMGIGETYRNVWKRAYRREYDKKRRDMATVVDTKMNGEHVDGRVELAFRIRVITDTKEVMLVLEWLQGRDQVLWESLCGMVHRGSKMGRVGYDGTLKGS